MCEESLMVTAEQIKKVHQETGVSCKAIVEGMSIIGFDDPAFAARYMHADSLAVAVSGNRHEWNMNYARRGGK